MGSNFLFISFAEYAEKSRANPQNTHEKRVATLSRIIIAEAAKKTVLLDLFEENTVLKEGKLLCDIIKDSVSKLLEPASRSMPFLITSAGEKTRNLLSRSKGVGIFLQKQRCILPVFDDFGQLNKILGLNTAENKRFKAWMLKGGKKSSQPSFLNEVSKNRHLFPLSAVVNEFFRHWIDKRLGALKKEHIYHVSGKHSIRYIDNHLLFSEDILNKYMARIICHRFRDAHIDKVVSYFGNSYALNRAVKTEFTRNDRNVEQEHIELFTESHGRIPSRYLKKLSGKKVLIVTDIVITGRLLDNICQELKRNKVTVVGIVAVVEQNIYRGSNNRLFSSLCQFSIELFDSKKNQNHCPGCDSTGDDQPLYFFNPHIGSLSQLKLTTSNFDKPLQPKKNHETFWKIVQNTKSIKSHIELENTSRHYYLYFETPRIIEKFLAEPGWIRRLKEIYPQKNAPDTVLFTQNPTSFNIAHHLINNRYGSANLVSADKTAAGYIISDDTKLTGKKILIVADAANTGKSLSALVDLCEKSGVALNDIKILIFIDRLTIGERQEIGTRIGGSNLLSLHRITFPTFTDDPNQCPLCLELKQLKKHKQNMSPEAKQYIEFRTDKIKTELIHQDHFPGLSDKLDEEGNIKSIESKIDRSRSVDFYFSLGETVLLEACILNVSLEKIYKVIELMPPEFSLIEDVRKWISIQMKDSKEAHYLTKLVRVALNIAPDVVISRLRHLIGIFAKSNRDEFVTYILEYMICEKIVAVQKVERILHDAIVQLPDYAGFVQGILGSAVHKLPVEIKCRPSMLSMYLKIIPKIAAKDVNVVIYGETGTGKEVLAKIIHEASNRRIYNFQKINISTFSPTLIESELFGHVEGAFTGAAEARKGKLLLADKGTAFLDEVSEIPAHLQVKILNVLEDKKVTPVGGDVGEAVDFRLICGTNKSLEKLIQDGLFRLDLYYRLQVITIELKPLRETPEDIEKLAHHFLGFFSRKHSIGIVDDNISDMFDLLVQYSWSGNVRELMNVLEEAIVFSDAGQIDLQKLKIRLNISHDLEKRKQMTWQKTKDAQNKETLLQALVKNKGNVAQTARRLGLSRSSIYNQMKRLKLSREDFSMV